MSQISEDEVVAEDGTRLVAAPQWGCSGCFFKRKNKNCSIDGPRLCGSQSRQDKRSVIWVRADTQPAPTEAQQTAPASTHQVGGDHYARLSVQPWDAMAAWLTPSEFAGFLRGNAIKYLARAGAKGPALEDYKKARHYLDRLIELETTHAAP